MVRSVEWFDGVEAALDAERAYLGGLQTGILVAALGLAILHLSHDPEPFTICAAWLLGVGGAGLIGASAVSYERWRRRTLLSAVAPLAAG